MNRLRQIIMILMILLIVILTLLVIYWKGTHYYPLYSFDDHRYQKVKASENIDASSIRFKNREISQNVGNAVLAGEVINLDELIKLGIKITKSRLHYDTATLVGRKNTDFKKVYRQHDVDWLYKNGCANCIGYAYLFAAVFNELKDLNKLDSSIDSCRVRIIYESPVEVLYGAKKMTHTWNEIIFMKDGKEANLHVDASAADYYLCWNVTKFVNYKHKKYIE